jgi:cell division septation protein DedD
MFKPAFCCAVVVLLCASARGGAQANTAAPVTAADSVFVRARQLVVAGNGAAGRVLVDSVVAATAPDTPAYGEALYWRAALAAQSDDAERDYRRIVVEYPLSPHAKDALLQLGQLEAARGDRAAAAAHLDRFFVENPRSPDRVRVGVQLVRMSFEQNDVQRGCTALGRVLSAVPTTEVETRNQLEYYSPRCVGVDTTHSSQSARPGGAAPSAPSAKGAKHDTAAASKGGKHDTATAAQGTTRDSAVAPPRPNRDSAAAPHEAAGRFTLQVAAYTSRAQADQLAKKLKGRGLEARVAGTSKLFRVRIGRYATRAAAAAAAKQLKTKKIVTFVTDVGADDK